MRHLLAGLFAVVLFTGVAQARPFDYATRARPHDFSPTNNREMRSHDTASRRIELRDARGASQTQLDRNRPTLNQNQTMREQVMRRKCAARANGGCGGDYENTGSAGEPF